MKWLDKNKSCPMCRTLINVKELVYIKKDNVDDDKKEEDKLAGMHYDEISLNALYGASSEVSKSDIIISTNFKITYQ